MRYWWVNQNQTFAAEAGGGFPYIAAAIDEAARLFGEGVAEARP